MNLSIRPLRAQEYESLAEAFTGFDEAFDYFEARYLEQLLQKRVVFVAWDADQPLGFANLIWDSPYDAFWRQRTPEIADLWVQPASRGRGVARALIEACERQARSQGYARIGISVIAQDPAYEPARQLYPRLGYLPDQPAAHAGELRLVKPLT